MKAKKTDLVIMGGGLAGMGLAKQLKLKSPDLDIVVLERRQFPLHETTAKIGESTIEIGSHYLIRDLALEDHIRERHLRKFGLRCFFGQPTDDFSQQDELGVSESFAIPTYQLERGVLENHLFDELKSMGVNVLDNAVIEDFHIGDQEHRLTVSANDEQFDLQSRWITDASGRQALVKNKLNLKKPSGHNGNAVWFRIDKTITLDNWSASSDWRDRMVMKDKRWLSTNHLMGPGYWIWIIPLASGATSIGIVMDKQTIDDSGIASYDDAKVWIDQRHPKLGEQLQDANDMDFVIATDYSYAAKQVFSEKGWFLTGEAGLFADPFYSPGSDFIAISNTLITHTILREKAGKAQPFDTMVTEAVYKSIFNNTLSIYKGQYGGFGDRQMMSIKLAWDYSYYWGVLALLFFSKALTDINIIREINPALMKAQKLNMVMQEKFVQRASERKQFSPEGIFVDQYKVPALRRFNAVLENAEAVDIHQTFTENAKLLEEVYECLSDMLDPSAPTAISESERELLGDYRQLVLA